MDAHPDNPTPADVARQVMLAAERISAIAARTPLQRSDRLSREVGADVWLKREDLQHSGSFKLRGAANRLLTLTDSQRAAGCVAASSGNHGAAVAYAMRLLGIYGIVFVPGHASSAKVDAIRSYGVEVRSFGDDGLDTEMHARAYADEQGMFYLSPYNDEQVIAGQGTCGLEIVSDLPDVDELFISVGGGGLISGTGSVARAHNPDIRVVGCQPAASDVMAQSIAAGRVVDLPSRPTLSDGTAGGIEPDAITFDLCAEVVDDFLTVEEDAIAAAMRDFLAAEGQAIEGAAALAIAALVESRATVAGKKVAVVVCGRNVSDETLRRVAEPA